MSVWTSARMARHFWDIEKRFLYKCSFDARKQYWVIFCLKQGDNTSIFIHFQSNLLESTIRELIWTNQYDGIGRGVFYLYKIWFFHIFSSNKKHTQTYTNCCPYTFLSRFLSQGKLMDFLKNFVRCLMPQLVMWSVDQLLLETKVGSHKPNR